MLQIKKVFLAISLCLLGLCLSLVLIYPGIGMPKGDYHEILSGVLIIEPCAGQTHQIETKYIALPHREERFEDGLKCYRFETMLPNAVVQTSMKFLLYVQGRLNEVVVNGRVVATLPSSDENHKIVRYLPLSLLLDKTVLHKTDNRLSIRFITYDPVVAISGMGVGHVAKVDALFWALDFFSNSFINAMNFLLLIIGAYFLYFSFAYDDEKLLGSAGRSMLLLFVLCKINTAEVVPTLVYPLWRASLLSLSAMLALTIIEFMLGYAEKQIKTHEKTLMWIGVLCLFFSGLIFDDQLISLVSFTIMFLFNVYCLAMIVSKQVRQKLFRSWLGGFYFLSFLVAYAAFMHDFMLMPGHGELMNYLHKWVNLSALSREEIFVAHTGVVLLFCSMVMIVVERYQASRDYAEREADRIYGALTRNEAELRTILDQQNSVQATHIIQNERQRLLFEIHTGIGLRLQEGYQRALEDRLTPAQFVDVFQDCIDDMRLIMDCISMRPRAEIDIIVGAMLHRMQPRMVRQGIELYVEPHRRLGDGVALTDVQCLYVGRMIQSSLTHALRLDGCTKVVLSSRETTDSLFVCCLLHGSGQIGAQTHPAHQAYYQDLAKRSLSLRGRLRLMKTTDGSGMAILIKRRAKVPMAGTIEDPAFQSLMKPVASSL